MGPVMRAASRSQVARFSAEPRMGPVMRAASRSQVAQLLGRVGVDAHGVTRRVNSG